MGQAPVKRYNEYLRDLIVAGRAKPSVIVSHRLPLEKAPEAYEKFDQRIDGYTKILLKPAVKAWGVKLRDNAFHRHRVRFFEETIVRFADLRSPRIDLCCARREVHGRSCGIGV